jgi:hypothetical protein
VFRCSAFVTGKRRNDIWCYKCEMKLGKIFRKSLRQLSQFRGRHSHGLGSLSFTVNGGTILLPPARPHYISDHVP